MSWRWVPVAAIQAYRLRSVAFHCRRVAHVAEQDRRRWDERYASRGAVPADAVEPPSFLASHVETIPAAGKALDLACGQGRGAVWLARQGLDVLGVDVSPVAIGQARDLARRNGVDDRCRFIVFDLDDGLPAGPQVDVILCQKFRDRRLDQAIINRLAPRGVLAMATLSEVDAVPGPFRATPGELVAAFDALDLVAAGEGRGCAWLLARAY